MGFYGRKRLRKFSKKRTRTFSLRAVVLGLAGLLSCTGFGPAVFAAEQSASIHVTILVASQEGSDFDLDNDAYRDQLIQLFSYKSYHQKKELSVSLKKGERVSVPLPEGYELLLNLQDKEKHRISIQAVIRKGRQQYVDSVLSLLTPGVVFLGGPPISEGTLILVLESHS
jgi:hypothetical protein